MKYFYRNYVKKIRDEYSLLLIVITSAISVIISLMCLYEGITTVFPHIYYIPIILSSYFYPKKGVLFSGFLGIIYLSILILISNLTISVLISAIIRVIIFVSIAIVVSYLSEKQRISELNINISKNRFKELFNNISEGAAIYNPVNDGEDFEFLQLNKAGEKLEKIKCEEIAGKTITEVFPDTINNGFLDALKDVYKSKKPKHFPQAEFSYNNIVYWRENYVFRLPSGELVAVYNDVTQKKRDEELIKNSQERLEMAFSAAGLGSWSYDIINGNMDLDESCIKVNQISREDLPENLTLNQIFTHIYPEDVYQFKKDIAQIFNKENDVISSVYRVLDKDGFLRWIHLVGKTYERDDSGKPLKVIGIVNDISEMRKYQDGLMAANKKLNLLSSITRHDILNQVTALSLFQLLIRDQIPPESEINESVEGIDEICKTIEKQIKFTKEYQNLGVKAPLWNNISDVLKSVDIIALNNGVKLSASVDNLYIFADTMINKVFYNLIENSIRHGKKVSKIQVSFHINDSSECIIYVEDDGVGVSYENKENIFAKGFGSNTGLGLFLTKEILEITKIDIKETGIPGSCSRFEIIVPKDRWKFEAINRIS